jgi:serine/threonine protein kinase
VYRQLCSAIRYLHSNLIVHLDIKPENVLLDHNMKVILTDFGFAKHLNSPDELINDKKGTPYYAPIEIGKGMYSPFKADIWSLGVVFYMMIELKVPFDAERISSDKNLREFMAQVEKNPLTFNEASKFNSYHPLITRMLEKDPEFRYDIYKVKEKLSTLL